MNEKKIIGYGKWLKFVWEGHICNGIWRPRTRRRCLRELAYARFKMEYLKKYIPFVESLSPHDFSPNPDSKPTEQTAYSLWLQGEANAPHIVKQCLASIRKYFPGNLIVLEEKDLAELCPLPDFIMEKWHDKKIIPANFSDIVRINLLFEHGGYWFDATDFMTSPVPSFIAEAPFFLFVTGSEFLPAMFIQSCFMHARQGNALMGMWRELIFEYWKYEEFAIDYFLVHKLLQLLVTYNPLAARLFEEMPKAVMDPTHLLWHKIGNLPFETEQYKTMCRDAFFQKCSYKPQKRGRGVNEIIPGSFADVIINNKCDF